MSGCGFVTSVFMTILIKEKNLTSIQISVIAFVLGDKSLEDLLLDKT
jgi:hypothetical protein